MAQFISILNSIFSTFGAAVIVPVFLFIMAKAMGVTGKKSFNSALLCAVGLTGFNLVINSYSGIIAPVVNQMVENSGVQLNILDTGWQSTSVIAYSTEVGLLFIAVAIILQLVLFFTKWTDVFMASDLWNNYSFMVWGSMLYALTHNMLLAMALMICQLLYILLFSEMCAKRWSTYYMYPNCCMTAPHHLESLPFAIIMNVILGKLGFDKIKINAQTLQKKLGILGEPMFIGLIVGAGIGIIGNINAITTLAAWGTISSAAVSTAAIMAVFPKVAGIFASAFTAMTDAYKSKAAKSGEGREWYLSVNDACGYGEPNTLVSGIILIPIMLVISFILPGNQVLPMADLCALPYMVEVFVCVSNGNIVKSSVMGAIWFSLGMLMCTQLAPTFTEVAVNAGFQLETAGIYITSFGIMCHPLIGGIFFIFWKLPIVGAALFVIYVIAHLVFKKNRTKFVDWLENLATSYSANNY